MLTIGTFFKDRRGSAPQFTAAHTGPKDRRCSPHTNHANTQNMANMVTMSTKPKAMRRRELKRIAALAAAMAAKPGADTSDDESADDDSETSAEEEQPPPWLGNLSPTQQASKCSRSLCVFFRRSSKKVAAQ